jgi:hypothetical protein
VVAGVGVAVAAHVLELRGQSTRGWSSASGTVLASSVAEEESTTGGSGLSGGRSGTTHRSYRLVVKYEYRVGGEQLTGDRYQVGGDISSPRRADIEEASRKYAPGSALTVYYDPGDPSSSVIARGVGTTPLILAGFS